MTELARSTRRAALMWCAGLALLGLRAQAQSDAASQPAPAPYAGDQAADIHLACHGIATFPESSGGSAVVFSSHGSASGFASETHRGSAEDEVYFDVVGGSARIKLPGVMIPPIHSGDDHGWRPVDQLQIADTEITGKFSVNFLNKPTVSINRVTGHIDVRGIIKLGFSGECRPYDASPAARKF